MARDPEEALRLAADPATDWATMYEIAQTNPEVHAVLAGNPATYPDLLIWLGSLGNPVVDSALARRAAAVGTTTPLEPEPEPEPESEPEPELGLELELELEPAATATFPIADDSAETQLIQPVLEPAIPPSFAPTAAAAASGMPLVVERAHVPPDQLPPQGDGEPAARRFPWAILGAVAVLLIVLIVWLVNRGGADDGAPTTAAPTTAATSEAPTEAATTPGPTVDIAAESQKLAAAMGGTQCADPATEAAALVAFGQAVAPAWDDAANQTVRSAISTLQARCNAGYAVAASDQASGQSAEIAGVLGARDWVVATMPAPGGGADLTAFSSPSGNIACTIDDTSVVCSISTYSFEAPETCPDQNAPVTAVVDAAGAGPDCGLGAVAGGSKLGYGSAAVHSHFACTSEQSGMTCWDTWTGASFELARSRFRITEPVLGIAR